MIGSCSLSEFEDSSVTGSELAVVVLSSRFSVSPPSECSESGTGTFLFLRVCLSSCGECGTRSFNFKTLRVNQALVARKADSAIHRINHYPVDKPDKTICVIHRRDIYPVDSTIHLLNNWSQINRYQ